MCQINKNKNVHEKESDDFFVFVENIAKLHKDFYRSLQAGVDLRGGGDF